MAEEEPDDPNLVWHYTSLGTLISILQNNSLMATEVGFQNDPFEEGSALKAMSTLVSKVGEHEGYEAFPRKAMEIFDVSESATHWDKNADRFLRTARFIACASLNGDSLYAWRTYGSVGSIGCAIGLDRNHPLGVIGTLSKDEVTQWTNVIYSDAELADTFLPDFEALGEQWKADEWPDSQSAQTGTLIRGMSALWPKVRSRAKHSSYQEEIEARVSVVSPHRSVVHFRDGRLGPRPYVLLGSTDKWGHGSDGKGLLPIRSVRLGPDASPDAEKSLKWLLALNGYPVDGEWEHIEWENEDGTLGFDERFNEATAIQISYSRHAYRDV